jgi:DNA polymerase-3 subunit alpha
VLKSLGVRRWVDFESECERGASAGRLAAIVVSARERKSQKGNKFAFAMFSDQTGQFEAVIFSDTLAAARDLLNPGTPVLISVEAERDGETIKMRVQSVEALDKAAANAQRGWRIVLDGGEIKRNPQVITELMQYLVPGGKGEVRLGLQIYERGRELEIPLKGRFDVAPAHKGRVMTVPGVLQVVDL